MIHEENHPYVSLIVPCRNEEKYIDASLESILANDYPKDRLEVWVVDGMSEDGTRDILEQYAQRYPFVRILDNPKKNVCAAMNRGFEHARGEIVFKMDAHSTFGRDYISRCVTALRETAADNVGGKFVIQPGDKTLIAKGIALAMGHPFGIGREYQRLHTLKEPTEIETVSFGCFRKDSLERMQLAFNENLARGGDSEFNARLREKGGRVVLVPDIVFYYFGRPNLKELWKHQFSCSYWVVYWTKFGCKLTFRSFLPILFVLGLFALFVLALVFPAFSFALALPLAIYVAINFYFALDLAVRERDIRLLFLMPIIFATLHFARGLGAFYGAWKRLC